MPTDINKANRVVLLENRTGATTTSPQPFVQCLGGTYILTVDCAGALGAMGGTTLTLNKRGPSDQSSAVANVSITVAGTDVELDIGAGVEIQAVLTGGSPVNVYCSLVLVRSLGRSI